MKVGSVLAEVKTMPSKDKGLPIQSSDIILGEPGIGKGQSFQCRDDLLDNVKGMLMDYANEEMTLSKLPVHGPLNDGERGPFVKHSNTFKYVDGVERLSNMDLPFLVDLPNCSCEAVFLTASRNAGCELLPILE